MVLHQELKEKCAARGVDFQIADLNTANLGLDKHTAWPVMVMLPPSVEDEVDETLETETELDLLLLSKENGVTTSEVNVTKVYSEIVVPMRVLGRKILMDLLKEVVSMTAITYTPAFAEFDAHVHGVIIKTRVKHQDGASC